MKIVIESIPVEQKPVLARMLELYQYDFTEFTSDDLNADGCFGYKYLDAYWIEEGRYPFFIRVDGRLAGFALVRSCAEYNALEHPHNIAEFFVMKKYRRCGIGKTAAMELFDRFPGGWEVSVLRNNLPAKRFWEAAVAAYTGGRYAAFTAAEKEGFTFENDK